MNLEEKGVCGFMVQIDNSHSCDHECTDSYCNYYDCDQRIFTVFLNAMAMKVGALAVTTMAFSLF